MNDDLNGEPFQTESRIKINFVNLLRLSIDVSTRVSRKNIKQQCRRFTTWMGIKLCGVLQNFYFSFKSKGFACTKIDLKAFQKGR